jgi:hypothetical protein
MSKTKLTVIIEIEDSSLEVLSDQPTVNALLVNRLLELEKDGIRLTRLTVEKPSQSADGPKLLTSGTKTAVGRVINP